ISASRLTMAACTAGVRPDQTDDNSLAFHASGIAVAGAGVAGTCSPAFGPGAAAPFWGGLSVGLEALAMASRIDSLTLIRLAGLADTSVSGSAGSGDGSGPGSTGCSTGSCSTGTLSGSPIP